MKTITKILIAVLILSGLMPLMMGTFLLFNQLKAAEMFHIGTITPDLDKIFLIMSVMMFTIVTFHAAAVYWIVKRKAEGLSLSLLLGFIIFISAAIMLVSFKMHGINDSMFYVIDFIKGILILLLTLAARKKQYIAN